MQAEMEFTGLDKKTTWDPVTFSSLVITILTSCSCPLREERSYTCMLFMETSL